VDSARSTTGRQNGEENSRANRLAPSKVANARCMPGISANCTTTGNERATETGSARTATPASQRGPQLAAIRSVARTVRSATPDRSPRPGGSPLRPRPFSDVGPVSKPSTGNCSMQASVETVAGASNVRSGTTAESSTERRGHVNGAAASSCRCIQRNGSARSHTRRRRPNLAPKAWTRSGECARRAALRCRLREGPTLCTAITGAPRV